MTRALDPDVRLLQAAADPTRLAILRQLAADGPTCACDFSDCCAVTQPTMSHHLRVLREAGWIEGQRSGTWIWYSLRADTAARFAALAGQIGAAMARPTGGPGRSSADAAGGPGPGTARDARRRASAGPVIEPV